MLRERLTAACDHVTPERNIELVAAVAQDFPHGIRPLPSAHDLFLYTCLVHSLRFTDTPEYLAISTLREHNVFAGAQFAQWLVNCGHLAEISPEDAPLESLVMYFDDAGAFKHVGLLRPGGRVESKWGQLGLFEHPLFEVPSNHGTNVRYFEPVPFRIAIKLFYDFAKQNGVQLQGIAP